MEIIVAGDLHGNWGKLNSLISRKSPEMILQCGDFGWWPSMEIKHPIYHLNNTWVLEGIKSDVPIYWCDGNHEDHSVLEQEGIIRRLYKSVHHCQRGSTITLPDGRDVLFMGGAESVDRHLRTPGRDWFPEEMIKSWELDWALSHNSKIDIVISHTAPSVFELPDPRAYKNQDPIRILLDHIYYSHKPALWYFGHWHRSMYGKHEDTHWEGLDHATHGGGSGGLG